MVRQNDPFWDYVEKLDDGPFKCAFCGYKFAAGTSISRIKWHLSGVKGRGVKICENVRQDVQDAARAAIDGPPEKKLKTIACLRNNEVTNAISTCPQQQNNEVDNLAGDEGRIQLEVHVTEQGVGEGRTSCADAENHVENMAGEMRHDLDRGTTPEGPIVDAHDTRGNALLATNQVCQVDIERTDWQAIANIAQLMDKEDVDNGTERLLQPVAEINTSGGFAHNASETKGDALLTCSTKLVGEAFEENKNVILSWLMNDEVSRIGIYGMGGVGKTTLLKHIHNQLLETPDISHRVYWVTMSRDFNIDSLQDLIAKWLDLDLSKENDKVLRAVKLSKELKKKQKWVLILDDLWNDFELDEVGIPYPVEGCKLILTTRSLDVCRRMDCIQTIKVEVLSKNEAWTLFMEKLTHDVKLSPEVEQVAQCVMSECAGLPMGIITVARSMRGVDDLHEWRNTLQKLKQSKCRDMEDKVFGVLKYSYDRLNDFALQQCLLYCALFPEDYKIVREDLIGYLIDEGIIEGMDSREAEFDEGHTMLNKLENFCLLESCTNLGGERALKMHDLIRDMAHQILRTKSPVMVSKKLPDVDEWKEDLVRVSFVWGYLKEIPSSHSPRCPSLSTLLLHSNSQLRFIADSFFKQLHGLKVLDLSYTNIFYLPDSVSDLVSLNALLLKECWSLRHLPSLKKLRTLKKLDLSRTSLKKMPQGLECLSNLRYLRLNGCDEKEFPSGILPKISHLQVLITEDFVVDGKYAPVTVKGKEVACLRKLETLECYFEHLSDLVEFIKYRDGTQSLSKYKIRAGQLAGLVNHIDERVVLGKLSINRDGDFQFKFPNNREETVIFNCNDANGNLYDVPSLIKYATKLEIIKISDCNSMESFSSSRFWSAPPPTPSNGRFSSLIESYCR